MLAKIYYWIIDNYINFLLKLMPHKYFAIGLVGALKEAIFEMNGKKYHYVLEEIPQPGKFVKIYG